MSHRARWRGVASAALVALVGLLALAPTAARGNDLKAFERAWAEAGPHPEKKLIALEALAQLCTAEAAQVFVKIAMLPDEPAPVLRACTQHLAALEGTAADGWILERARKGRTWVERAILIDAIGLRASEAATEALGAALGDADWQVQAAAVRGLGRRRTAASVGLLIGLYEKLKTSDAAHARLEGDVRDALYRVTGGNQGDARGWRQWWDEKRDTWTADSRERALEVHESSTTSRIPALFEEVYSRRVVFVVDTSYSMHVPTGAGGGPERPGGETRFEVMVRELRRIVGELPPKARFNIIRFDDDVAAWSPRLQAATPQIKRAAERFIDSLEPKGATNSFGALEAAFKDPEVDTIIFLSDGFPTAGQTIDFNKIADEVRKWNHVRQVRVHTIAFLAGDGSAMQIQEGDKSMPKEFMGRLARENEGRYRLVD